MTKQLFFFVLITLFSVNFADALEKPRYFDGKRLEHTISIDYASAVEEIFLLLCPVREYDWMASWKGTIVYTESGYAEPYVVFYHGLPFPLISRKAYWIATQYNPDKFLQWCITVPGICIIIIDESLAPLPNGGTQVTATYRITGLSKFGNRIIGKMFSEESLMKEIERSRDEIDYYIKNGSMLPIKYKSGMFN